LDRVFFFTATSIATVTQDVPTVVAGVPFPIFLGLGGGQPVDVYTVTQEGAIFSSEYVCARDEMSDRLIGIPTSTFVALLRSTPAPSPVMFLRGALLKYGDYVCGGCHSHRPDEFHLWRCDQGSRCPDCAPYIPLCWKCDEQMRVHERAYKCGRCDTQRTREKHFHCRKCNFDLCEGCAPIPPGPPTCAHCNAPMYMSCGDEGRWRCSACGEGVSRRWWRCVTCQYNLCQTCCPEIRPICPRCFIAADWNPSYSICCNSDGCTRSAAWRCGTCGWGFCYRECAPKLPDTRYSDLPQVRVVYALRGDRQDPLQGLRRALPLGALALC
jgi:hypothetical protein